MAQRDLSQERPPDGPEWEWFHLVFTFYGNWLYGDARGFRTRHHREHVEGDYKSPPPKGEYEDLEQRSRDELKQPPVTASFEIRKLIGQALLIRLNEFGAYPLTTAVSAKHVHLLCKLVRNRTRRWTGLAKKHTWFVLNANGWKGKLWGKRGKYLSVKTRDHHSRVHQYILNHQSQGAWIWNRQTDPIPPKPPDSK